MSRIGSRPITLPDSVKVEIVRDQLNFTGPKGNLSITLPEKISATIEDGHLKIARKGEDKVARAFMVLAALSPKMPSSALAPATPRSSSWSAPVTASLSRAATSFCLSATRTRSLSLSTPVSFLPSRVTPKLRSWVSTNSSLAKLPPISGNSAPEPYKGKGIRYSDEVVRRKAGKAAAKSAA